MNDDDKPDLMFTDKEWQTVIDCLRSNGEPEYADHIESRVLSMKEVD